MPFNDPFHHWQFNIEKFQEVSEASKRFPGCSAKQSGSIIKRVTCMAVDLIAGVRAIVHFVALTAAVDTSAVATLELIWGTGRVS